MNIIIFSKDRPCQLELFLRSVKKYFKEFSQYNFKVLYTYSDSNFEEGYKKLFKIHNDDNISYIKEGNKFKDSLLKIIDKEKDYSIFFVDDIIFKNKFTLNSKQFKLFTLDDNILTLSLRLHNNLTYCYPARIHMNPPKFESNMSFRWRGQPGDYGYPMSLDGHFFRTKDILTFLKSLPYNNPNSLESYLSMYPLNRPKMICFEESIIMNLPINKVQNFNQNVHGNISAKFLNDKFLENYIIDLEPFDGFKNMSCHQEVEIKFIKDGQKR